LNKTVLNIIYSVPSI